MRSALARSRSHVCPRTTLARHAFKPLHGMAAAAPEAASVQSLAVDVRNLKADVREIKDALVRLLASSPAPAPAPAAPARVFAPLPWPAPPGWSTVHVDAPAAGGVVRAARVESVLDLVGATPVVRLTKVIPPTSATVWLKLESENPSGSVKDRAAKNIVLAAEARGELKPGMRLIEGTSGNTGIGLALVAAARGYGITIVMPDSVTLERRALLKAYGATLVLTPGALGMKEAVRIAAEVAATDPSHFLCRQFENEDNAAAHVHGTAAEVLAQVPELDAFVAGVGTGGTITGVGRALRARAPHVRLVAVEPASSPLLTKGVAGPNKIQGIGANFIPPLLDRSAYDSVEDVEYDEAIAMARRLAREEALLSGISTGAIVAAAAKVAAQLGRGKTVVAVLCDVGERYLSHELYTAI